MPKPLEIPLHEGTDTHLMLVDVTSLNITGKEAEKALEKAGITVNKNTIPYDCLPPQTSSGIRIGTPAITTRGMKETKSKNHRGSFLQSPSKC